MAFSSSDQRINSVNLATSLLGDVRSLYTQAKSVQTKLALYNAGSDATFNAAINALFTSADRTELATMLGHINTLVTAWETNHKGPLNLP